MEMHRCGNSWVCCDGECMNCSATKITISNRTGEMGAETEYIDREAAIAAITSEPPDAHYPQWYADKILAIPVTDVAQVRHGRWLSWDELHGGNTHAKNVLGVFCSECIRQSDSKSHFCPNCGAVMEDAK